mmetsp:Transcript_6096/g.6024  ORF Transcript_6096/g.6024 Transcript_6096/m.6024 type:complete len:203 (+) Transcript_6096:221-829(+)
MQKNRTFFSVLGETIWAGDGVLVGVNPLELSGTWVLTHPYTIKIHILAHLPHINLHRTVGNPYIDYILHQVILVNSSIFSYLRIYSSWESLPIDLLICRITGPLMYHLPAGLQARCSRSSFPPAKLLGVRMPSFTCLCDKSCPLCDSCDFLDSASVHGTANAIIAYFLCCCLEKSCNQCLMLGWCGPFAPSSYKIFFFICTL